jgi:hypothetical protein
MSLIESGKPREYPGEIRRNQEKSGPPRTTDPKDHHQEDHHQEDPGMDELATHLEGQTLSSQSGLALHLNSSEMDDSLAGRLARQLYSIHGCTTDAHNACDDEYAQSPNSYTSIPEFLRSQKSDWTFGWELSRNSLPALPPLSRTGLAQACIK